MSAERAPAAADPVHTFVSRGGTVLAMRDTDPFVELRRMPQPIAEIVKGALAAEGIDAEVRTGLGAVYGIDAGPFVTRLYVRQSDRERAEALIVEVETDS
jgi:hypothetical protein